MNKNVLGIGGTVVLGALIAFGAYEFLAANENTYLETTQAVSAGQTFDSSNVTTVTVHGEIPGGVLATDHIVGTTALANISAGTIITKDEKLDTGGSPEEQVALKDPNSMVYTLAVDNTTGVSPNLKSGDYVAAYTSYKATVGGQSLDVDYQVGGAYKVVDTQMDPSQSKPVLSSVTIQIPKDSGTFFDFATSFGKVHLAQVANGSVFDKSNAPVNGNQIGSSFGK